MVSLISPSLPFYTDAPASGLSLGQFKSFARDRLHVLHAMGGLEESGSRGHAMTNATLGLCRQYGILLTPSAGGGEENEAAAAAAASVAGGAVGGTAVRVAESIEKDLASHHILRLACCRSEDHRRWFLRRERALFRARLDACDDALWSQISGASGTICPLWTLSVTGR